MAVPQPSRLIYAVSVRRGQHFKRAVLALLAAVSSAGAAAALAEASARGLANALLLDVGTFIAIVLVGLFSVRVVQHLFRWATQPSAEIRVYDQGLLWQVGRQQAKFRWKQLLRFREGARGWYLFGRPLLTWGAHTLEFLDDDQRTRTALRFTAAQGSPRAFAAAVRPFAASITGMRIGAALRRDEPVRLHRALVVYPGGVEAGKQEIHWTDLELRAAGSRVLVRRRRPDGKIRTVRRYPLHALDNAGGLFDIAASMRAVAAPPTRRQTAGPPAVFRPGT